jgi:hypothetical protein
MEIEINVNYRIFFSLQHCSTFSSSPPCSGCFCLLKSNWAHFSSTPASFGPSIGHIRPLHIWSSLRGICQPFSPSFDPRKWPNATASWGCHKMPRTGRKSGGNKSGCSKEKASRGGGNGPTIGSG